MTKMNWLMFKNFIFSIIILAGCIKAPVDNTCISYTQAPVINITGSNTGSINQSIPLTVYFGCFNGCGQFGKFEQSINGNTTTINVIAKYQGCICTQDAPIRQTIYNFSATQPGTYHLNFLQTGNTYFTHTIIVQ